VLALLIGRIEIFVKFRLPNQKVITKRVWLFNAYTGSEIVDGRQTLVNKTMGFKILKSKQNRDSAELQGFYAKFYQTNQDSKYQIASDACPVLKKITRGIPNSTWILSKFHATTPIFNKAFKRRWLKKITKQAIGYYEYLRGNFTKIYNHYKSIKEPTECERQVVSLIDRNKPGIEAWKSADYGNNAEHMASIVKGLLRNNRRIMSELAFIRLLEGQGFIQFTN